MYESWNKSDCIVLYCIVLSGWHVRKWYLAQKWIWPSDSWPRNEISRIVTYCMSILCTRSCIAKCSTGIIILSLGRIAYGHYACLDRRMESVGTVHQQPPQEIGSAVSADVAYWKHTPRLCWPSVRLKPVLRSTPSLVAVVRSSVGRCPHRRQTVHAHSIGRPCTDKFPTKPCRSFRIGLDLK